MRVIQHFPGLVVFMILSSACNSDLTVVKSDNSNERTSSFASFTNLEQALRTIPGLEFEGSGNALKVLVRGKGSILYNTSPLFVVNGTPMGNNYASVNNAINVQNIKRISVINGVNGSTRYGVSANHGVIQIELTN